MVNHGKSNSTCLHLNMSAWEILICLPDDTTHMQITLMECLQCQLRVKYTRLRSSKPFFVVYLKVFLSRDSFFCLCLIKKNITLTLTALCTFLKRLCVYTTSPNGSAVSLRTCVELHKQYHRNPHNTLT